MTAATVAESVDRDPVAPIAPCDLAPPAAILRGTAQGLEIVIDAAATRATILEAIETRLAEAPGFFRGSDVRVRVEAGKLPAGTLGALEDIAARFELAIVEVGPQKRARMALVPALNPTPIDSAAPFEPQLAAGSAPATFEDEVTNLGPTPNLKLEELLAPVVDDPAPAPELVKIVIGPVRSGVILDHAGHVVVFGDVNPGAEVRALGNIVVLGRLRGTAHAGIGGGDSFIMALRLEPQQLRIGRRVTRAGEGERPGTDPELAHVVGDTITVERFTGKLPRELAASLTQTRESF